MSANDSSESGLHFKVPQIQDNPLGWGPCELPDQYKDMPYQPFSKGDRLGKISDWTGATFQDKKYASKLLILITKIFKHEHNLLFLTDEIAAHNPINVGIVHDGAVYISN